MQSQLGAKHQSVQAAKPRPEFQSVNEYQSVGEAKPRPEYQYVQAAKPRPEFKSVGAAKPEFQSVGEYQSVQSAKPRPEFQSVGAAKPEFQSVGEYQSFSFSHPVLLPETAILQTAVNNYISEDCATITTCTTPTQYGEIGTWCVKLITDMSSVFYETSFNSDISRWEVGRVTNMRYMFDSASSFNIDNSSWDVSLVTNMYGMFYQASSFNSNISNWDVSSVKDMDIHVQCCIKLQPKPLSLGSQVAFEL